MQRIQQRAMILGMAGLVIMAPAHAEMVDMVELTDEEIAVELGHILVSPRRMMPGIGLDEVEFPGNSTIITAGDIASSGVTTVQEALHRAEGITFIDTHGFGLGSDTGVNIRGVVNSSRTNAVVLVDGVPQNRVTGDEVHWLSLPVEQIERIEILRGGGGTMYGEGALAGVISIETKKSSPKPLETTAGAEIGSFGHHKHFTSLRGSAGPLRYGTSYSRRQIDCYRDSSGSRSTTVTGHLGMDVGERWQVETNVLHSEDTTYFAGGITPEMAEQNRRAKGSFPGLFDDETDQVGVNVHGDLGYGFHLGLNGYWRHRVSESVTSHFVTETPSTGLGARLSHTATGDTIGHTFLAGVDLSDDKATTGTRGSTTRMSESNRTAFGLYVEETVHLGDALTLIGGYRFDTSRYAEDLTFPDFIGTLRFEGRSPRAGVTWHLMPYADLFGSAARVHKAPNIDDMDAVDNLFRDNTDLEAQTADHYEVGMRVRPHAWWPLELEATYFHIRIADEIIFDPFAFQNNNFDTKRNGVEVSLRGRWWDDRLVTYANYTFVKARFRQGTYTGYRLPITPEHQLKMGGAVEIWPHLTVGMDWSLVNRQFRINDFLNQLPADNYGVARLTVRYEREPFTAFVNIENITNEEYVTFQSSSGTGVSTGDNPAPPLWVLAGLTVTF